jgi:hypothetical protein
MAVSFDAQAFKDWTGTGGTVAITPVGVPKGVIVGIAQAPLATDQITSVTWGGAAMTRVATNGFGTTSGGEPGACYLYFLGSAVAATGTVNVVSTAGTFTAFGITVTANQAWTHIAASAKTSASTVTSPSVTIPSVSSDDGVGFGVLFSSWDAPSSNTVGAGLTAVTGSAAGGRDFGSQSASAEFGRKSGANVSMGWTTSAGSAAVVCAALVSEIPPTVQPPNVNFAWAVDNG